MATERTAPWSQENVKEKTEDEAEPKEQRRRSTTVIVTNNVSMPKAEEVIQELYHTDISRRKLSKQSATVDEPPSLGTDFLDAEKTSESLNIPAISEEAPIASSDSLPPVLRPSLQRGLALCGDDDTKLRPASAARLSSQSLSLSRSFSRESVEYTDRNGTNLLEFIRKTLHKSQSDRKQLLFFEMQLTELFHDVEKQSRLFRDLLSSYNRMVLHRCAALFGMDHNITNKKTEVIVNKSSKTQLPLFKFQDLIEHDRFFDDSLVKNRLHQENGRPVYSHACSFGNNAVYMDQSSLRRVKSYEVHCPQQPYYEQSHFSTVPCEPTRPQPLWIPQRSFDCAPNCVDSSQTPCMKKADSFGGMNYVYRSHSDQPPMNSASYYQLPQPSTIFVQRNPSHISRYEYMGHYSNLHAPMHNLVEAMGNDLHVDPYAYKYSPDTTYHSYNGPSPQSVNQTLYVESCQPCFVAGPASVPTRQYSHVPFRNFAHPPFQHQHSDFAYYRPNNQHIAEYSTGEETPTCYVHLPSRNENFIPPQRSEELDYDPSTQQDLPPMLSVAPESHRAVAAQNFIQKSTDDGYGSMQQEKDSDCGVDSAPSPQGVFP
ncbi:unnamed protein product [Caenorhabditis auriculariae]|uniref:R3H domain-containing protein n=1 Tax=Caenorhabditis auriculariae TaxID=2777116 RepID=A0A8S1H315_9PELO|nr:unnamed protein product [Caenorhabditis auriculariae]